MNHVEIMRVPAERISHSEFVNSYYKLQTPVILSNAISEWKAKNLTPESLDKILVNKVVDVHVSKSGVFDPNKLDGNEPGYKIEKMKFTDLVKNIRKTDPELCHYLQQKSLTREFPILSKDIGDLKWLGITDIKIFTAFWVGAKNAFSPLHLDFTQNFFAQIYGQKMFTLFHPSDTQFLYPSFDKILSHISEIRLDKIDFERYPLAREAKPYSIILDPGDVLFLPERWWHHVHTLDTSISVNIRWSKLFSKCSLNILKTRFKSILNNLISKR